MRRQEGRIDSLIRIVAKAMPMTLGRMPRTIDISDHVPQHLQTKCIATGAGDHNPASNF
jgi:hypothetical protein